uniref:atlastin-3-like n=1 Tax=Styela clava TaxID=7725 RepID=UPI00193931BD|nr:atlastin-3-like [Styela clava]
MYGKWGPNFSLLVRDWPHPTEKCFGNKGGEEYFNSVLESSEFATHDLMHLKGFMTQIFKTVNCFLMPHPGMETQGKRNVGIDDLSAQFTDNLQPLVSSVLGPKFLQGKVVRQKTLTGREFLSHVEKCVKELAKPKKAPKPCFSQIVEHPIPKKYLRQDDEWIGDKSDRIADGFEWCSGSEAHTQGIMIFSEPFIVATPNGEVAVLFMDTQGLFDSNTSKTQNLMIFAFNTIISSVQILNLSGNINEHDLEFLQFFTEYARRITQEKSGRPFLQVKCTLFVI